MYSPRSRTPQCRQSPEQSSAAATCPPSASRPISSPASTTSPTSSDEEIGSKELTRPSPWSIETTGRSTTVPTKLIVPAAGASTGEVSGASRRRSTPRCPEAHGRGGAEKPETTSGTDPVGEDQARCGEERSPSAPAAVAADVVSAGDSRTSAARTTVSSVLGERRPRREPGLGVARSAAPLGGRRREGWRMDAMLDHLRGSGPADLRDCALHGVSPSGRDRLCRSAPEVAALRRRGGHGEDDRDVDDGRGGRASRARREPMGAVSEPGRHRPAPWCFVRLLQLDGDRETGRGRPVPRPTGRGELVGRAAGANPSPAGRGEPDRRVRGVEPSPAGRGEPDPGAGAEGAQPGRCPARCPGNRPCGPGPPACPGPQGPRGRSVVH